LTNLSLRKIHFSLLVSIKRFFWDKIKKIPIDKIACDSAVEKTPFLSWIPEFREKFPEIPDRTYNYLEEKL